jgi:WD40-like Beta Propeller Repeat
MKPWVVPGLGLAFAFGCTSTDVVAPWPATLQRVHELRSDEGVFAYSRISPDGRFLAYASEARGIVSGTGRSQIVTVVDLTNGSVVFREPGIDGYWSPDGERMIFLSFRDPWNSVAIRHHATGAIVRAVAPDSLGDYFSWGETNGVDRILTIRSRYYDLVGDVATLPAATVPSCAGIGVGERPLISKDARRITTFVRGTVVVRNLTDCADVLDTGLPAAKADFSYDGRYIAFHTPNTSGRGYEIQVVDLQNRTMRTITRLSGSSFFPSWTQDGRLVFRYDGDEYRGFVIATDVLSAPEQPLPRVAQHVPSARAWSDIFPETQQPPGLALVLVWGTWSAHAPQALVDLQRAREHFDTRRPAVRVLMATEPGSREEDVAATLAKHAITLERIHLAPERLTLTEAHNQNPTALLFRDGVLIDRRLGAQTFEQLVQWVRSAPRA